ncbi:hypothetical protein CYY_001529 [Polysphondylium violaceum]|uniref:Major facilitator superfamily (MFS) profile domain-containing protein n=1 Tax=Polysphondylium violaceum TaxID=133409 RepID=A0A8J4VAH5_9MYCE|nr:hypothetical protein CYY_001529 [Polysphondylium violaceum]
MAVEKKNLFTRVVEYHYNRPKPIVQLSDKQKEREKYIFGVLPFNRWLLFPSAVLVQFCIGSFYAWSIYNKPIDKAIYGNENQGMAPITFYITVGVFGISAALMGPWIERHGPRLGVFIGAILFTLGHYLTAVGIHFQSIWVVYIGYGVFGGFGIAITYISPVSTLQKWFPNHRGLSGGFAVCGFGAGSVAFGQIPLPIIKSVGLPLNFVIIGSMFFVILTLQCFILRVAPDSMSSSTTSGNISSESVDQEMGSPVIEEENYIPSVNDKTITQSLLSKEFRLLYIVFLANSMFGLIALSRLSNMIQDIFGKSKETAAMVVTVNGIFNLTGRLGFALLSDKIGRKPCYIITLSAQAIIVGILPSLVENRSSSAFIALIWLLTSAYGGGFGIIPGFLTDLFGPKKVSTCHGIILTAWSVSGIFGGVIFTEIMNALKHSGYTVHDPIIYTTNFHWIICIILIGWICIWFVQTNERDILTPPIKGQTFKIRLTSSILLRISTTKGFERVSQEQQDLEWKQYCEDYKQKKLQELNDNTNNDTEQQIHPPTINDNASDLMAQA